MSQKRYEEGSIADYAARGYKNIKELAKSDKTSDKLEGFNILLFVLVGGLILSFWLFEGEKIFSASYGFILVFSLILSSAAGFIYSLFTDLITDFADGVADGLRLSILIEFIALSSVWTGLLFNIPIAIKVSAALLVIQIIAIIFGQFISLTGLDFGTDQDTWSDFWGGMGKIATIITVGTFLYNAIVFVISVVS